MTVEITIALILGVIGSLGLIYAAVHDVWKKEVYIIPFGIALLLTGVASIMDYSTVEGQVAKYILIVVYPFFLFAVLFLDMKFNSEEKVGGADLLGFASILYTCVAIGIMHLATGTSLMFFWVWLGNVVIFPMFPALLLLGIIEYVMFRYKKSRGDKEAVFAAPMVPVISFIQLYIFISSAVQYL